MTIDVCYVVNSVSETSVPATLGTAICDLEDVNVDVLAWFSAEPFEGDETLDVECLDAPAGSGLNRATYRDARKRLRGYDVIQVHTNHSGAFAKVIGSRLGIPVVSREGNTRDGFTRKGRIANGVTNALADRIVPNSQAVYDSFRYWERLLIDDDDVTIIPNGVDLDQIDAARQNGTDMRTQLGISKDAVVVGTAAVLSEQKGLDVLVEGIHRAMGEIEQDLEVVIAGDGPERSNIEHLVDERGLNDRVHFTGMVDRKTVYQLLGAIDIYAMPSRWEGFSMAAVEALASETACLFSDIDPFLLPYRNVALFHSVDDVDEFSERLVELARDEETREFYGQKGRALVEQKYTIQNVARKYASLYEELI